MSDRRDPNYYDTFIAVAEDCPVSRAEVPVQRAGARSVPAMQYELIVSHPYGYTQADVLFEVHAERSGIPQTERAAERVRFFARGRPCLRASSLGKRYGWGIHHDVQGRVALYPMESQAYRDLAADPRLHHVKAMRGRRGGAP